MIKADMGCVNISGPAPIIMTEFTNVIKAIYESLEPQVGEEKAKEVIADAGKYAFYTEDELKNELKEKAEEKLEKLKEILGG